MLVHYWATWCEPCKQDLDTIKSLQAKYGKEGFYPVGVNLDNDAEGRDRLPPQRRRSPGRSSMSKAASTAAWPPKLGILTLPTMILVGKDGKVLNRNIHAGELDAELKKLLR